MAQTTRSKTTPPKPQTSDAASTLLDSQPPAKETLKRMQGTDGGEDEPQAKKTVLFKFTISHVL
jgi:hypothetical protein